jgi:hypothetical protein
MLSTAIIVADMRRNPTTANVTSGSAFPWPYGWSSSAGLFA